MKTISNIIIHAFKVIICTAILICPFILHAQTAEKKELIITLQEAVSRAKTYNKNVQTSRVEQEATLEDLNDAKASVLPSINFAGSYQRFTDLTLYSNGLSGATTVPKKPGPNGADFGVSGSFNLYSGGRTRALQTEQDHKTTLAGFNANEVAGNIGLQAAGQYLDLIRLTGQRRLIEDQRTRAETRLRNINALYRNQKITRSDVLRAELMLSNVNLSLEQTENDIAIGNKKLNVLMDMPENTIIKTLDTLDMQSVSLSEVWRLIDGAAQESFGILKLNENLKIQFSLV